jgi:hypothetical protein
VFSATRSLEHSRTENLDQLLASANPALHSRVAEPAQTKFTFTYQPLDKTKIAALPATDQSQIESLRSVNNQSTLSKVAVLPAIMFVCYIGLILYFRQRGGYQPVEIQTTPGTTTPIAEPTI